MLPAFNSNQKNTTKGSGGLPVYQPAVVASPKVEEAVKNVVSEVSPGIIYEAEKKPSAFQRYSDWANTTSDKVAAKVGPALGKFGLELADIWSGGLKGVKDYTKMTEEERTIFKGEAADSLIKGYQAFGKGTYDFLKQQIPSMIANTALAAAENPNVIKKLLSPLIKGTSGFSPLGKQIDQSFDTLVNTGKAKEMRGKVKGWADNVLVGLGEMQKERMTELGITDESSIFDPANFGYQLSSGATSMAAAIGVTYMTKSPAMAGAMLGWLEGSGTYSESKEKLKAEHPDWSEEKINSKSLANATIDSAGIALLEKIGLDFLFRSYGGGALSKAAMNSITESLQETSQTAWSNLVAKYGYDKSRGIMDDVIETFIITMPIGFFGGGIIPGGADTQILTEGDGGGTPPGGTPPPTGGTTQEDYKDDPSYLESLEKIATQTGLSEEEVIEIGDAVIPQINDIVAHTGKIIAEGQKASSAFSQDVQEAITARGEEQTLQDIVDNPNIPIQSREEAKSAVDTALEMFAGQNDEVMSAIKAAEQAVRGETAPIEAQDKVATKELPQTSRTEEDILGELSDSEAAQEVWTEEYSEKYGEMTTSFDELQKKAKEAKGEEKEKLTAEAQKISEAQAQMEDQFVNRMQAEARRLAVEETINEVKEKQRISEDARKSLEFPGGKSPSITYERIMKKAGMSEQQINDILEETQKVSDERERGYDKGDFLAEDVFDGITEYNYNLKKAKELSTKEVAASKESGIIEDNGKSNDDNSKRDVLNGELPPSGDQVASRSEGDRGGSNLDSDGLARGQGDTGDASARERLSTPVRAKISTLETALQEVYLNTPVVEEIEGTKYTAADIGLANIFQELQSAEAGYRYQDAETLEFKGVSSTFPAWMPENARTREDINYVLEAFKDVKDAHYPQDPRATAKRALADAIFDGIDFHAEVDTKQIRSQILELYEKGEQALTAEELEREYSEESIRRYERVKKDKDERQKATGLEPRDIETIIKQRTVIFPSDGAVEIAAGEVVSDRDIDIVSQFVPAGGRENQGAEGRGLLDEYYTPEDIPTAVVAILEDLGAFKDGMRVLEPSVGTGNFLGDIPMEVEIDAYEINETAARIAKMSYAHASIYNRPFESFFVEERGGKKQFAPIYDLVIGNPPYGEHRGKYKGLGEEAKIAKYEEYFLKRALDLTKEGGYVAMVLPSGFLRSGVSGAKVSISQRGDLVEAYRLPNGAFETTDIGTDILVFKKHDYLSTTKQPNTQALVDDTYFNENPDRILGEAGERTGKFGPEAFVKGDLGEAIDMLYKQRGVEFGEEIVGEQTEYIQTEEVEAIGGEGLFAYKPEVYKETRQGQKLEAVEATAKSMQAEDVSRQKKSNRGKTLDLSTYSTAEQEEANMWKFVSATGELVGDFPKTKAYFENGKYYNKFNYLQGDIYEKLDQLEKDKASLSAEQYEKQKKELEAVKPERVGVDRMSAPPNSRFAQEFYFTPTDRENKKGLSEYFIEWVRKLPRSALGESSAWALKGYVDNIPVRGGDKLQNEKERKTRRLEGDRLFKLFLKDELSKEKQVMVEDEYNRRFNSYARPDYRNVPLVGEVNAEFHNKPLDIRDVQLQGIGFLVNRGVGLLAHDVGVGKTMQAILAVNESLKRGWAKKPLVVVPSVNVYNQWIGEINELLPDAKITLLANLGGDFKGDLKTLQIEEGTISLITEEGFKRLGFTDQTYDELTKDFQDVIEEPVETKTKRAAAKGESKAQEEVGKGMRGTRVDRFFEDLGFDMIVGDEIHNANHIVAKAKMDGGKTSEFRGFQTRPSLFGIKMWLATQYILKKNNNRNVFLLSATPFTNNPLEYYSILSLMARERMKRMGIVNVNDFMTMFMEISSEHEFRADGTFKEKNEVRAFKNYQQFQKLLTEFIDFRDGVEAGVKRPDRVGKEYIVGETVQAAQFKDAAQELFKDKDAGTLKAINELRAIAFSPFASRYYTEKPPSPKEFVEGSPKIKATTELIKQSIKDNPDAGHLIYSTIGVEYFPLIRQYLIEEVGLGDRQVEIISGATPKEKRSVIQENFNNGKVKVVLGSDAIQEGVNLQRNSTDLYILSLPWNFTAMRQVIGRIWRQGNKWPRIRINSMFTENSVDTFLSQKLQNKEKRYEQSLQFKGDTLDVGDINFEEMKFDLITDPVARVELEYQFKEKELEHEIATIESERAYKHRKADKYMEALQKLNYYKLELKNLHGDSALRTKEYYQDAIKNMEVALKQEMANLQSRGFDLENLEKDIQATDIKIADLKEKIEVMKKEKEKALSEATKERATNVSVRDTNYEDIRQGRHEENQTFYEGGPLFDTVDIPIFSRKPVEEMPEIGITEEEREALMAYYSQGGRIDEPASIPQDLVFMNVLKYDSYEAFEKGLAKQFDVMGKLPTSSITEVPSVGSIIKTTLTDAEYKVVEVFGDRLSVKRAGATSPFNISAREVKSIIKGKSEKMKSPDITASQIEFTKTRFENILFQNGYDSLKEFYDFSKKGRMSTLIKRALNKYVDYMATAQKEANDALFQVYDDTEIKLDRAANDIGRPFDIEQFNAEAFIVALFGKDVAVRFAKGPAEVETEAGKVDVWGSYAPARRWREPLIRLVVNKGMVQSGVLFHEAFHGFIDTQISKEEKQTLLDKTAKNPATLPARLLAKREGYDFSKTAEEWLAEDFARYVANQQYIEENAKLYTSWLEKIRTWVRKNTGADMVYHKILANMQVQEQLKIAATRFSAKADSVASAKNVLEEYKKRFNLKFDVDFAQTILTPGGSLARAVTYNNKITLTENLRELTAHHEFVHLVAVNLNKIPAFAGITEGALLKAMNGGRDYTASQVTELHEKLAMGFENFVAKRQQKQATIVGRFYQKLLDLITEVYQALGAELDTISDFYQRLATAKGGEMVELTSDRLLDAEVRRFDTTGNSMLDFDMQARRAELDEVRRKYFDEIESSLPFGDQSENLIKKDINFLENWTAQARDIYLKDPNEFGSAKIYENIGDSRRMKKQALDMKFSKIMEPYMKLKGGQQERVNKTLMEGDRNAVEYDEVELEGKGLSKPEIEAYKAIREAFNIGHELLLSEMAAKGVPIEEINEYRKTRIGYMPHKWPHKFAIKTQEVEKGEKGERWKTTDMSTYKSEKEAKAAFEEMRAANAGNTDKRFVLDTLGNLDVDFFSQQGLSFEALKSVISQARTGDEIKASMLEAVRNMFKEKGFGRNFLYRTGVQGYETNELPKIIANYFAGLNGFITKMEAAKKYYDNLTTVDARRQNTYYNWLRDAISYDLGNTKEFNIAKKVAFTMYLANDISFLLINATQNWTIGVAELSKIAKGVKPELTLIKATTDYWTNNITPDEKMVIDGLIKLGALGGEQVAELTDVKNNPLYTEISSKFNKIFYSSTSFIERAVNRVPAFLAARRLLIQQGVGPKEANEKALEISEDIHFRYGKQHRPRFMRGGLGTFFIFNHYARSLIYQLSRDLSNRDFKVFARKMLYTTALGGITSLPFASLLVMIFKKAFGAGDDDEGEEEMSKWDIAIKNGLPAALTGVDFSQRVGLEFLGVNSVIEHPEQVKSYIGVVGSIGESLFKTVDLAQQGRYADALARILPDMAGNLITGYTGYQYGVRSFAGTPLEEANGDVYKYNTWEAIIKATGFTPIREKLLWNAKSNQWASDDAAQKERTDLRRKIQFMVQKGQFDEARALQEQARTDEVISEKTDYVRDFGKDTFFTTALKDLEDGVSLRDVEKELISSVYGGTASDAQKNNIRKDLAVYRAFGTKNNYVNDIMTASTNQDKMKILLKAKETLSEEEFDALIRAGRKTISTEAGNSSRILISDDLYDLYKKND